MRDPRVDEFLEAIPEEMGIIQAWDCKPVVLEFIALSPLVENFRGEPKGVINKELERPHCWEFFEECRRKIIESGWNSQKEEGALRRQLSVYNLEGACIVAICYEGRTEFIGHRAEEIELRLIKRVDPDGVLHGSCIGYIERESVDSATQPLAL
jgi:hypothetical protein